MKYIVCIWCGNDIPKKMKYAKYCSNKCRYEASGKIFKRKKEGSRKN